MKSITRKISKYNFSSRSGQKIKYIIMHFTGNNTDTALNNANYFGGGNRDASAHYFVDNDNIVQVVEENNHLMANSLTFLMYFSIEHNSMYNI